MLFATYLEASAISCAFDLSSRISFGSFFAHPEAHIGSRVYVGSYCILGKVTIGDRALLSRASPQRSAPARARVVWSCL
jgi:hypothetical protein